MSTVTYKNQPAIDKTRGSVPLAGNEHLYTVSKLLWPEAVEGVLADLLISKSLHVCCGKSGLGDIRLDAYEDGVDIKCDAADMSAVVGDDEYASVLCDPPYNGKFRWNHDMLSELARVASQRIIFQHWFIPATKLGFYKKAQNKFELTALYAWQPRSYFGRVQMISVFDRRGVSS